MIFSLPPCGRRHEEGTLRGGVRSTPLSGGGGVPLFSFPRPLIREKLCFVNACWMQPIGQAIPSNKSEERSVQQDACRAQRKRQNASGRSTMSESS